MVQENIGEYLRQAGCPDDVCERLANLEASGRPEEGLSCLAEHRLRLAAEARIAESRLDCLDRAIRAITANGSVGRSRNGCTID